jgi:hypothetical protein
MKALKTAHEQNKKGRWWIKADATDLNQGLRESVNNKWSGDVDLGDGTLDKLRKKYLEQLSFIKILGLKERHDNKLICQDFCQLKTQLHEEMLFLNDGLKNARHVYNIQIKRTNVAEQSLFALAWDVDGYEKLVEKNSKLQESITEIEDKMVLNEKTSNLPKELKILRSDLEVYVKGVFMKKREVASHLLVFMISDEYRNFKPYAVPVQVLAYKSITDVKVQKLKNELKAAMTEIGMKVVGKYTI